MSQANYSSIASQKERALKALNPRLLDLPGMSVIEYERLIYARPDMEDWLADMVTCVMRHHKPYVN
ncbi:hypothetical protein [Erwinia amylovora]|uniref:hypothetical protein n=1 Tax=Erwinia amylovora TaxID=552 RepID=UPI001443C893|nr:hypothetical protein [Erwinia amylovora]